MNIVFATDENYARFTATAIVSLVRTHHDTPLNISILDSGITDTSRARLQGMSGEKITVRLYVVHQVQAYASRLLLGTYFTAAAFSRLFIPELLQDEQRALYLDSDVLVLRSLYGLYQSDMGGKPLLMVQDIDSVRIRRSLNLPRYFNTGVILFDLERCRQLQLTRYWREYLNSTEQRLPFADQDVINIISQREIGELPVCYNMQSDPSRPGNTQAIVSAWDRVVVLHFLSENKPWLPISHPFDNVYLRTMLGTPWAKDVPKLRRRKYIHHLFHWQRFGTVNKGKRWILYVLGIPFFSRYTSLTRRTFYLFGIPFFTMLRSAASKDASNSRKSPQC